MSTTDQKKQGNILEVLLQKKDDKDQQQTLKLKKMLSYIDYFSLSMGIFTILISVIEYYSWYSQAKYYVQQEDPELPAVIELNDTQENQICFVLRCINIFCTVTQQICIIIFYNMHLKILKLSNKIERNSTLKSSGLLNKLIFELFICSIVSVPHFNYVFKVKIKPSYAVYSANQIILNIVLIKSYLIYRVWGYHSYYNQGFVHDICNLCYCQGGVLFAIKSELTNRPFTFILVGFLTVSAILGYGLQMAEQAYMQVSGQNWTKVENGFWCIWLALTTVGYGDYFPVTIYGRFFVFISVIIGPFLVSLTNVAFEQLITFKSEEKKAYDEIKKQERQKLIEILASDAIKNFIRYQQSLQNNSISYSQRTDYYFKFKRALNLFRKNKILLIKDLMSIDIEQLTPYLIQNIINQYDKLGYFAKMSTEICKQSEQIKKNQQQIGQFLKQIKSQNEKIKAKIGSIEAFEKSNISEIFQFQFEQGTFNTNQNLENKKSKLNRKFSSFNMIQNNLSFGFYLQKDQHKMQKNKAELNSIPIEYTIKTIDYQRIVGGLDSLDELTYHLEKTNMQNFDYESKLRRMKLEEQKQTSKSNKKKKNSNSSVSSPGSSIDNDNHKLKIQNQSDESFKSDSQKKSQDDNNNVMTASTDNVQIGQILQTQPIQYTSSSKKQSLNNQNQTQLTEQKKRCLSLFQQNSNEDLIKDESFVSLLDNDNNDNNINQQNFIMNTSLQPQEHETENVNFINRIDDQQ